MSKYLIQDSTLSSIANVLRYKLNISNSITAYDMISNILNIEACGEDIFPYEYASSNITYFSSTNKYVLNNAFYSCASLTEASFPNCKYIGAYAFRYCSALTTASFPACTYIGEHAFNACSALTTASFPVCTTVGSSAFYSCYSLTTASFPACTIVGNAAFRYCSALTTASFPACTTIGGAAFYRCYSLTTASFPACTNISTSAFRSCTNLISLYLTGSSVVSLANSNAFTSTPIGGYSKSAGRYGSVYVPSSLLTAYKAAYGWSKISARIVGI